MLRIGMMTEYVTYFLHDLKKSLKLIKDLGYECCDITLMKSYNNRKLYSEFYGDKYLEKAKLIKEYADSINLPLVQAHAPFPVYQPRNYSYNKRMFDKLVKCIKICNALGIKNLVIHPWNDYTDDQNIKFFNKLLPYAVENDVIICTENMWRWNKNIQKARPCACSLPDSFNNIVKGVNSHYLKACVDIGHAEMFKHMDLSPRILLESLNKDVYCLHIHDNDGIHDNHLVPFSGVIDYLDCAKGLKNINYKNDLIAETRIPDGCNLNDAVIFWKDQLIKMNKFKDLLIK